MVTLFLGPGQEGFSSELPTQRLRTFIPEPSFEILTKQAEQKLQKSKDQ